MLSAETNPEKSLASTPNVLVSTATSAACEPAPTFDATCLLQGRLSPSKAAANDARGLTLYISATGP